MALSQKILLLQLDAQEATGWLKQPVLKFAQTRGKLNTLDLFSESFLLHQEPTIIQVKLPYRAVCYVVNTLKEAFDKPPADSCCQPT